MTAKENLCRVKIKTTQDAMTNDIRTVIVCFDSEYANRRYRCYATREDCESYQKDGTCNADNKPCNAVECRPVVRSKWLHTRGRR